MKRVRVDPKNDGIFWLINRQVFCPRGYALAYDADTGEFFLYGDGGRPMAFEDMGGEKEQQFLARIKDLMS